MSRRPRVLITGASGRIGRILTAGLSERYEISGLDRRGDRSRGVRRADLTRLRGLRRRFEGVDAVIDLAAQPSETAPWKPVYENNMATTINVFQTAQLAGIRRVVYASSCHAAGMYERDEPYASICAGRYEGLDPERIPRLMGDVPARPDGPYGVAKVMGEAAGRWYAEEHGMTVICLRLGSVPREDRPGWVRAFATWLSYGDLVRLTEACLRAPAEIGYRTYFGVSANTWRFWDVEQPREEIGYAPRDDAERWRT
jgi:nucleoside-diphosphate-sugar epimerase